MDQRQSASVIRVYRVRRWAEILTYNLSRKGRGLYATAMAKDFTGTLDGTTSTNGKRYGLHLTKLIEGQMKFLIAVDAVKALLSGRRIRLPF